MSQSAGLFASACKRALVADGALVCMMHQPDPARSPNPTHVNSHVELPVVQHALGG